MDFKALSAAIKAAINNQGLQIKAVAESIDVSASTLSSWLNKGKKPEKKETMPAFFKLVDKFNINFDDFADYSDLGGRVEHLRLKNKLAVFELAKKANLHEHAITQIESKVTKRLRGNTAQKLANALGTTVDYILNGLKNETPQPENETVFQKSETVRNGLVMLETRIDELATKKWHSHIAELLLNGIDKSLAYQVHIVSRTNQQIVFGTSNQYILADVNYRNRLVGAVRSRLNDQDLKFEFVPLAEQSQEQAVDDEPNFTIPPENEIVTNPKVMLSTEIAALTGKNHKDVMRDIRVIVEQMQGADLRFACESTSYKGSNGQEYKCYELDYEATMIVMTGYDVVARAKVIKRWQELETLAKLGEAPKVEPKPRRIDHLSPEVISVLKQARTVQLAMGMGKQQASRYARELVFDRFGIDMELATTGSRNAQLSIVK